MRANERFSGRGHRNHLCKECSKLPKEERAFRQVCREIDRLAARGGKRNWRKVGGYLEHPDERVRAYVAELWDPWIPEEEEGLVVLRDTFGEWGLIEAVFEWEWVQEHWDPGEPPEPEEGVPLPETEEARGA